MDKTENKVTDISKKIKAQETSNKMTRPVSRFVKAYITMANEKLRESYLKTEVKLITNYVPYITKCNYVENLVLSTCFENKVDENGKIVTGKKYVRNKATQNMLYQMMLINIYTNLNIEYGNNDNHITEQYDELNKYGLINYLLSLIPKSERDAFGILLTLKNEDTYINHGSLEAVVRNSLDVFMEKVVSAGLDSMQQVLSSISASELKDILSMISSDK